MRPKGILGSCLVLSEPKMRLLWLKTYKRPFLHWQSLPQLPHMWATGSEGETKKLSLFVVPEPRAVLAKEGSCPPPPWTCWARHIKSLDGFVFFRLSYFDYGDLQLFAIFIFEVDFSETYLMTSAENNISEPPNLKILWGRIAPDPPTRLLHSALAIMPPPLQKT